MNEKQAKLYKNLRDTIVPTNGSIAELILTINPVLEFDGYFKYGFIYKGKIGDIEITAYQEDESKNHDDIYRADLSKSMTLQNLRTQLDIYLWIQGEEYRLQNTFPPKGIKD